MRYQLITRIAMVIVALTHGAAMVFASSPAEQDSILLNKIDQMLVIGFRGTSINEAQDIREVLRVGNLGGVILFDYDTPNQKYTRNISSPSQTRRLLKNLQQSSQTPLFTVIDEEGGNVSRLKPEYGFDIHLPSAKTMSRWKDTYLSKRTKLHAKYLQAIGFNTNLAPVVDLSTNPDNPAIVKYNRSFGASSSSVARIALTILNSYNSRNILTSLKHFPGHGSSTLDSHQQFVDITNSHSDQEYAPYQALCAQKSARAVMVGHLFDSSVDPILPASLSTFHIEKLRALGCFNQLIISDDYDMKSIRDNYSLDQIVVNAITAGVDVLIFSNNIDTYDPDLFFKLRKTILANVKNGSIPIERINSSYAKITSLKKDLRITQ